MAVDVLGKSQEVVVEVAQPALGLLFARILGRVLLVSYGDWLHLDDSGQLVNLWGMGLVQEPK